MTTTPPPTDVEPGEPAPPEGPLGPDRAPTGAPAPADEVGDEVSDEGAAPITAAARFAIMVATFAAILAVVVAAVLRRNGGTFTYAIDDPFIHLTIARNLGRHATFGLVPGVYESASSAPAWNLLLAPLLAIAPGGWWWPLLINVAAACWVLRTVSALAVLGRFGSRRATLVVCVATPVLLGLVPLVLSGMEHTLHAALVATFLVVLARLGSPDERHRDVAVAAAILAVGTLVRFETGFVAVAAALVVLAGGRVGSDRPSGGLGHRRWSLAAVFVAASALPALAFAAVNLAFGQYPLPSSIVAKSAVGSGIPWPDPTMVVNRLGSDPILMVLLGVSVLALGHAVAGESATARTRTASRALAVVLLTAALHLCFAETGWFERYQAYLIVASVVALGILAPALAGWPRWRTWVAVALVVLCVLRMPLLVRTPAAAFNVYQSQYQMGRFLAGAYPGEGIAVNDIGWVSWLHEGPLLDVVGLGSVDALRATEDGELDAARFAELAADHDVRIVAVYERYYSRLIPPGWSEVGRWCVPEGRVVLSAECVTFSARSGPDADAARAALERFAPELPPETVASVTAP